jgi:uncharacterized membrane protein YhhN
VSRCGCDDAFVNSSLLIAIAWTITGACALLDWYAVWRGDRRLEAFAKPATMVALVGAALAMGAHDLPLTMSAGTWLLVALAFGLLGDVMLLSDTVPRFKAGLAAFLVGHLAYLVTFAEVGLATDAGIWGAAVGLMVSVAVTRDVVPNTWKLGGPGLAIPVAAYTFVIGAMLVAAWMTGEPLIAVGATVFVASDTILARNRFVSPLPHGHLWVMITYFTGQALIVLGVLG